MTDIRQQLLAAFEDEHREHLRVIRHALDRAEQGAAIDTTDVFRRAHSLKGASRAVDLPVVEEISHYLETLLAQIESGERALDPAATTIVRNGLDAIEDYVAGLPDASITPATGEALAALKRFLGVTQKPAEKPAPVAAASEQGVTPKQSDAPASEGGGTARVAAEQIEALSSAMHQLMADLQAEEIVSDAMHQIDGEIRRLRRGWDDLYLQMSGAAVASRTTGQTDTPSLTRSFGPKLKDFDQDLKSLFRKFSSLSRQNRQLASSTDRSAQRVRENIERVSLVSVETVFGTFGHMVRDLARGEGKDVHVRTVGFDIQADRRVLQALKDPIMHLLRNAVSHGVELPQERVAKAKPPQAEVVFEVASHGGRLSVCIRDDGRGPDLARIEEVATQRGLLEQRRWGQPAAAADQLLALVFAPGFSTAASVDRLAGRGMGLSVVAEAVGNLRGSVIMRARYPFGTEVFLSVPFTAARQPLLLVESAGHMFALPTHNVERLIRAPTTQIESVEGRPALRIDIAGEDVMVPVVALAAITGTSDAQIPIEAGSVKTVLVRQGARHCALAVNAFHDVRTMLVGDVEAIGLGDLVFGTVVLENEVPALVLSPEAVVAHWVRHESRLAGSGLGLAERAPDARQRSTTILVVDDSITTRTLEKSILEAQGYRVLLSVDGLEALTLLRSGEAIVDLIIADVEMPRMDGFSLLQAVKNDSRLAAIPVILMTSRSDAEDVRRGLDLGASAYITKQKFDQRELLGTIGQLL